LLSVVLFALLSLSMHYLFIAKPHPRGRITERVVEWIRRQVPRPLPTPVRRRQLLVRSLPSRSRTAATVHVPSIIDLKTEVKPHQPLPERTVPQVLRRRSPARRGPRVINTERLPALVDIQPGSQRGPVGGQPDNEVAGPRTALARQRRLPKASPNLRTPIQTPEVSGMDSRDPFQRWFFRAQADDLPPQYYSFAALDPGQVAGARDSLKMGERWVHYYFFLDDEGNDIRVVIRDGDRLEALFLEGDRETVSGYRVGELVDGNTIRSETRSPGLAATAMEQFHVWEETRLQDQP